MSISEQSGVTLRWPHGSLTDSCLRDHLLGSTGAPRPMIAFASRAEGIGCRTIASRLTNEEPTAPLRADREPNPRRHGRAWSDAALPTVVVNPKYKGLGSYRKVLR